MNWLSKRNINRMAVLAMLAAPIIYLFGTQFMALAGAHGEDVLADTTDVTPSYDDLMNVDNFSYGAFDWDNEHGKRLGFSLGTFVADFDYGGDATLYATVHGVSVLSNDHNWNYGLGYGADDYVIFNDSLDGNDMIVAYFSEGFSLDDYYIETFNVPCYFCFYYTDGDGLYTVACILTVDPVNDVVDEYYYGCSNGVWTSIESTSVQGSQVAVYFDDGAHLPQGVVWTDEMRSYFVPRVKVVESTSYRDALFGNMFGSRNFLTRIGENALSENPWGFSPFGALLSYVDDNVLHMGADPLGLAAYGYFYWCAHVLIFDLMFYVGTFFVRIIKDLVDMMESGVNRNV